MKRVFFTTLALILSAICGTQASELEGSSDSQSTTPIVLESKSRFGNRIDRIDREIDKIKFAYKEEWMMGITATYAALTTDNAEMLLLLENLNVDGDLLTVKPYIGYFYRDDRCAGVKFGYSSINGSIDTGEIDLGESNGVEMEIPYLNYTSNQYSYSIFHRSYAGLDREGHFGLFAEIEASYNNGSSCFEYENNGELKSTFSDEQRLSLSFNPGIAAYIMNNICATVSFQFGGVHYTTIKQYDAEGTLTGERHASKMSFKANLLAINIGFTYHLWR